MNLPLNIKQLRRRWESGERFEFFLFYGHKPPFSGVDASCLSQWFVQDFHIDGQRYPTAEHWMMAEKARLFGDEEMLRAILQCETPRDAKAFGRKVNGFDPKTWDEHKFDIVVRGNLAKFEQNAELGRFLSGTISGQLANDRLVAEAPQAYKIGDYPKTKSNKQTKSKISSQAILVEAAGRDTIWGIGLGQNNPKSRDPIQWRGENLLGFALTKVREKLLNENQSVQAR